MADFSGRNPHAAPTSYPGVDWYSGGAGSYGASSSYAPPTASAYTGYSSNSFEDEPPLLEELGIDLGGILRKSRSILLLRHQSKHLDSLDLGGALLFVLLLGGLHLLMGKLHVGIILGWSVLQALALYYVSNQLAGDSKALDLYSACCIVGYGMLPLCLYSGVALLLPRGGASGLLAAGAALWSAATAARLFVKRSPALEEATALLTYPCLLVYASFAMLCVY